MTSGAGVEDEEIRVLMGEEPKVAVAIKNYFSLKLAEEFAEPAVVHALARELSLALNAYAMPEVPEWGLLRPQGEEQAALDRMAQLATYKHLLSMRKVLARTPGAKATNLLGRTWATAVFMEVRQGIEASAAAAATEGAVPTQELRRAFLDGFQAELEGAADATSLVWTTDVAGAIAERHAAREKDARERLQRQASTDNQVDEMRALMNNLVSEAKADGYDPEVAGPAVKSGVQVVQLD